MPVFNQKYRLTQKAQAAIELAVFGAILMFVLGTIVRQTLGVSYEQNQSLKALRIALMTSYEYSEGLKGANSQGVPSRNSANVLLIEDRLIADTNKYGSIDRSPLVINANASHSRQFFMPIDYGNYEELPVMDMFINGQHFVFTLAAFKVDNNFTNNAHPDYEQPCHGPGGGVIPPGNQGCRKFYTIIINHPNSSNWCISDPACPNNLPVNERFNLNRDNNPNDVPPGEQGTFSWQWGIAAAIKNSQNVMGEGINIEENTNTSVDMDHDFKEERVLEFSNSEIKVIDYQDGDIDFSYNNWDVVANKPRPGLRNNLQMFSFVRPGTYFQIEEGKLFQVQGDTKQYKRSVQKKDQIDVIQREIQLSNDTHRFCDATGKVLSPTSGSSNPTYAQAGWDATALPNPVEVCCDVNNSNSCRDVNGALPGGAQNCFYQDPNVPALSTIDKTCLDQNAKVLFVRSRLTDRHGRKWVTDVSNDPYQSFMYGP